MDRESVLDEMLPEDPDGTVISEGEPIPMEKDNSIKFLHEHRVELPKDDLVAVSILLDGLPSNDGNFDRRARCFLVRTIRGGAADYIDRMSHLEFVQDYEATATGIMEAIQRRKLKRLSDLNIQQVIRLLLDHETLLKLMRAQALKEHSA